MSGTGNLTRAILRETQFVSPSRAQRRGNLAVRRCDERHGPVEIEELDRHRARFRKSQAFNMVASRKVAITETGSVAAMSEPNTSALGHSQRAR